MKFIQIICTFSNESQNHDLFWKLFPVLLSLSLTFILFYLSRIFDDHIKGKEVERNWYLKIVVDSNNKIIQDFFEEMVNEILKKNNTISDLLANLSNENKTYSNIDYSTTNIIIFIFYLLGVLGIVAGVVGFFIEKKEWAIGIEIMISSILLIGMAEFLKIMVRIEQNTRK
jgi:hypothetical protein